MLHNMTPSGTSGVNGRENTARRPAQPTRQNVGHKYLGVWLLLLLGLLGSVVVGLVAGGVGCVRGG